MSASYTQSVLILLVALILPTGALAWMLRPRRLREILRGGEVAGWLGFSIDSARRLVLIGVNGTVPYPGVGFATADLVLRAFVAMLAWGRLSQAARHRLKSLEAQRIGIEMLRDAGKDVSKYEKKRRLKPQHRR